MFHKLSLRMRLTLLTGSIIICTSLFLTYTSIRTVNDKFVATPLVKWEEIITIPEGSLPSIDEKSFTNAITDNTLEPFDITDGESSYNATKQSANLALSVAATKAKKQFDSLSYIYLGIIIMFGMILSYIISLRALKPVSNLSKDIKEIGSNNLNKRIDIPHSHDEIGDLTSSFNAMLDRLEQSFLQQKRFSSNAAHELKTPLATIKAGIQVLELDDNPSIEDYKETLEITKISTQRLIQVVDGLLSLTLENDENYSGDVDLDLMFEQIIDELEPASNNKNIRVTFHSDTDKNKIKGCQTLLYRAFLNIIENGIKYNKDSGTISISIHFIKIKGIYEIRIADSGLGIEEENLAHIFQAFYRVDKSRSQKVPGSGLGLSIVKTIIENHQGSITVESSLNVGTEFIVTLPQNREVGESNS